MPFILLRQALSKPVIVRAVDWLPVQPQRKSNVVATILEGGLRTFAILVVLQQADRILEFIETLGDQLDVRLPYEQAQIDRMLPGVSPRFCSEVQWEFIPHFFPNGGFHRRIANDVIIPYTAERRFDEGSGGEIFECVIAEGQHNFFDARVRTPRSNNNVALVNALKAIQCSSDRDQEKDKNDQERQRVQS